VRAKLAALGRVQPALEQGAEDRGIDLRPVAPGGPQQLVDVVRAYGQDMVVFEQAPIEPVDRREADPSALARHRAEQRAGILGKTVRVPAADLEHLGEQVIGQQADVFGEHAEYQPVDEMRDLVRFVPAIPEPLCQPGELACRFLCQRLPGLGRAELLGIGKGELEPVALRTVEQVLRGELVDLLHRVGPVGVDEDAVHVGHDQKGRVL
jgi:hypothetical protein